MEPTGRGSRSVDRETTVFQAGDEERVTYAQSLRFFIEGCSHTRVLKNVEMCTKQLLLFMNDASVAVHATLWRVIRSIFQR